MSCPYNEVGQNSTTYGCDFSLFAHDLPEPFRQQLYSYALSGRITAHEAPELLRLWFTIAGENDPDLAERVPQSFITQPEEINNLNEVLKLVVGHTVNNRKSFPHAVDRYDHAIKIFGSASYLVNHWRREHRKEQNRAQSAPVNKSSDAPMRQRGKFIPYHLHALADRTEQPSAPYVYEQFTVQDGRPPLPDTEAWRVLDPRKVKDADWARFSDLINEHFKQKHRQARANPKNALGRLGSVEDMATALGASVQSALDDVYGPDHSPKVALHSNLFFLARKVVEPRDNPLESPPVTCATIADANEYLARSEQDAEAARARLEEARRHLEAAERYAAVKDSELVNAQKLHQKLCQTSAT